MHKAQIHFWWLKFKLREFLVLSIRHRQQSDGALVISRVSSEDAGFFTCIASNGRDQDQRQVLLRPLGTTRVAVLHVCVRNCGTKRAGQSGFLLRPCLLASHLMFNRQLVGKGRVSCFS